MPKSGFFHSLLLCTLFSLLPFISSVANSAQSVNEVAVYWPETEYDPNVPTVKQVLGYQIGADISWSHEIREYFEALVEHAPEKIFIEEYGETWEGRSLYYAVISSPANIGRIGEIKNNIKALADPRRLSDAAAAIIQQDQPAVVWLAYGVHGNEISSPDAAMATAYHLLSAQSDARVERILNDTVVVIAPLQNPDGRDRFVHAFDMGLGVTPDTEPLSVEHDEHWPGGRTNHYLFDLNRDWYSQTQPEVKEQAKAMLTWQPHVVVDLHEMGSNSTYFFSPEARPFNPYLTADQIDSLDAFGKTNAYWFDKFGLDYFTREIFDAFYPGYGASWPAYFGSIAMTYEQASARGLAVATNDGGVLTFSEGVRNHFITSMGTLETAQKNKAQLLQQFWDYKKTAIQSGASGKERSYLFPQQEADDDVKALMKLLVSQGVEAGVVTEPLATCGVDLTTGAYVINTNQPAGRFIRTMLSEEVPLAADFVASQKVRRENGLNDQIYDVTAWSLPLAFNVDMTSCNRTVPDSKYDLVSEEDFVPAPSLQIDAPASLGYLIRWQSIKSVSFLSRALRAGLAVKTSKLDFVHGSGRYKAGTLIVLAAHNPAGVHKSIREIAHATGVEVVPIDDSWVTEGPSFGSSNVVDLSLPKVALLWDDPTEPYVAGSTRFVLEQKIQLPISVIRTASLRRVALDKFDVVILPGQRRPGYKHTLSAAGLRNLKAWALEGGVILAIGGAVNFLIEKDVEMLATALENAVVDPSKSAKDEASLGTGPTDGTLLTVERYEQMIAPTKESPYPIGGAYLTALADPNHFMTAGVRSQLNVMYVGNDIYRPIKQSAGSNVVRFADTKTVLRSGHIWDDTKQQLAFKPFLIEQRVGSGRVIAFTQNPNFRAQQDGLTLLFANSIYRSVAEAKR